MEYEYIWPFFKVHDGFLFKNKNYDSYSTTIVSFNGVFPSNYEVVERPTEIGQEEPEAEGDTNDK